jgi:glucan biosynthesis protein C
LILLPIFLFLNTNGGKRFLSKLASFSKEPYVILLFALPVVIIELLVNLQPQGIGIRVFGGWSLATYLIIFLMGYIIASNSGFQESLEKSKTVTLILAVIGMVAVLAMFKLQPTTTSLYVLKVCVRGLNGWFWVAAILGFGYKYLRFNNKFVQYATRAVLPFYILHQTVIVVIGYYWLDWNIIPIIKYFALAIASFIIVVAIYDLIVKRVRFIGFLFGLKLEK